MKNIEYRLYDTLRKKDLGTYTAAQIRKKLGVNAKNIPAYAKSHSRLCSRYLVEKVEEMTVKELCEEWDRVTDLFKKK